MKPRSRVDEPCTTLGSREGVECLTLASRPGCEQWGAIGFRLGVGCSIAQGGLEEMEGRVRDRGREGSRLALLLGA